MNPYDSILMIPGPTQLDEKVRKVMSDPQIGHSSEEFYQNFADYYRVSADDVPWFMQETGWSVLQFLIN